VLIKRAECNK